MGGVSRQLQLVALIALAGVVVAAAAAAAIGLWLILIGVGVVTQETDAAVGPIGVVLTLAGAIAGGLALGGTKRVIGHLHMPPRQALSAIVAVYGIGLAVATMLWTACSQGTGAERAGPALALSFAVVGLVALVVYRPTEFALAVVLSAALVAGVAFWWLNTNTAADGCPWYEPPTPTPIPAPTTTTPPPGS